MSALFGLWLVSITISAIALLVMVGLIIARGLSGRRQRSRASERRRLVPLLLAAESGETPGQDVQAAPDLLTDLSTEFIQMVRGTDKENFVASSSRLGVPERLRHRLDYGAPRTRLAAAEALADFGDDESRARLEKALGDKNSDVRLSAALALASAGRSPPAKDLVRKLGIGTRENSILIVAILQEIAKERPGEIKALIEDPDTHPAAKAAAIESLSASGDYTLVPLISKLVLEADPLAPELPRYLRALGDFGHPAAAKAVRASLRNDHWPAKAAAAKAAGRIGLIDLAPELSGLLDHSNWWVRFRAGEALVFLGEEGRRLLVHARENGSETARVTARLTLAERGLAA